MADVRQALSSRLRFLALTMVAALVLSTTLMQAGQAQPDTSEKISAATTSSAAAGTASDATKKMIDEMVMRTMDEQQIPAFALTIVKNDQIAYQRGFGFADLESKQPVTGQTIFGLGGLTKTFTSFALFALVDKNLIQLDAPLSKYLDKVADQWKPLTIKQLATMTAGISDNKETDEKPWKQEFEIAQKRTLLPVGSQFLNSNASYRTLGTVIEKVSGHTYLDYLKKTIFVPLSMNATGTLTTLGSAASIASAYDDEQGRGPLRKIKYTDPEVTFASGMLFSNSDDLVKYSSALLRKQLLSAESYKTMAVDRPPLPSGKELEWTFGWNVDRRASYGDRVTVSGSGVNKGVSSTILLFPDEHVAVIALCNLWKPASGPAGIVRNATQIFFGGSDSKPAVGTK